VQENLELGLLGLKGSKPVSKLDPVLERFPRLAERARQPATTLSGGEQQMLAMARIMVTEPKVALIDEPSEGLAPMIEAEIFAIVRQMRDEGLRDRIGRTEHPRRPWPSAIVLWPSSGARSSCPAIPTVDADRQKLLDELAV
jgi:energy-coupling factor transporter ATP-binding protein EcfA2